VGSSPTPVIFLSFLSSYFQSVLGNGFPGQDRSPFLTAPRRLFLDARGGRDTIEEFGESLRGVSRMFREFCHFGETELRVRKRKSSLGLLSGREQDIGFVLVLNLHAAATEQFEFPIKRAEPDAERRKHCVAGSRLLRKESDQAMKP